jgi:uncharacterized membrane protein YdcZ (DUF606 family)
MKFIWMAATFIIAVGICSTLQSHIYASKLRGWLKETISFIVGIATIISLIVAFAYLYGEKNQPRPMLRNYMDGSIDPIEGLEQEHQECWDKQGNYEC